MYKSLPSAFRKFFGDDVPFHISLKVYSNCLSRRPRAFTHLQKMIGENPTIGERNHEEKDFFLVAARGLMCFRCGTRSRSSRKHTEEKLPGDDFRHFIADDAPGIEQLPHNFLVAIPSGNDAHRRVREISRVRVRAKLEQLLNRREVTSGRGEVQRRAVECIAVVHVVADCH